jgi:hypothetical protein
MCLVLPESACDLLQLYCHAVYAFWGYSVFLLLVFRFFLPNRRFTLKMDSDVRDVLSVAINHEHTDSAGYIYQTKWYIYQTKWSPKTLMHLYHLGTEFKNVAAKIWL